MTTRSANEIQQSSLAVLHPTYVLPLCWEAQVWFHPCDSLLEDGGEGGGGVLGGQRKIGRANWYNRKESKKWNLKWGCCPWVISKDTEQQVFIVSSLNRWSTITVPTSQDDPKRWRLKSASSCSSPGDSGTPVSKQGAIWSANTKEIYWCFSVTCCLTATFTSLSVADFWTFSTLQKIAPFLLSSNSYVSPRQLSSVTEGVLMSTTSWL